MRSDVKPSYRMAKIFLQRGLIDDETFARIHARSNPIKPLQLHHKLAAIAIIALSLAVHSAELGTVLLLMLAALVAGRKSMQVDLKKADPKFPDPHSRT